MSTIDPWEKVNVAYAQIISFVKNAAKGTFDQRIHKLLVKEPTTRPNQESLLNFVDEVVHHIRTPFVSKDKAICLQEEEERQALNAITMTEEIFNIILQSLGPKCMATAGFSITLARMV